MWARRPHAVPNARSVLNARSIKRVSIRNVMIHVAGHAVRMHVAKWRTIIQYVVVMWAIRVIRLSDVLLKKVSFSNSFLSILFFSMLFIISFHLVLSIVILYIYYLFFLHVPSLPCKYIHIHFLWLYEIKIIRFGCEMAIKPKSIHINWNNVCARSRVFECGCAPNIERPLIVVNENPCIPSPCGPYSICRTIGDTPACSCLPNYVGRAPNCRPECSISAECPANLACIHERCADPCPGSCGFSALCHVVNHSPVCSCLSGYTGDPFSGCHPVPSKKRSSLLSQKISI